MDKFVGERRFSLNYLVVGLFFFTPLESFRILPYVSIPRLLSVIIIMYGLLLKDRISFPKTILAYGFYVFFTSISAFFGFESFVAVIRVFLTLLPIFLLALSLAEISKVIPREIFFHALNAWIASSILLSLVLIYKVSKGVSYTYTADEMRLTVLGQDQNELSYMFVMALGFLMLLRLYQRNIRLHYIQIVILVVAVILTGSRTGFMGVLVVLFLYSFNVLGTLRFLFIISLVTITFSLAIKIAIDNYYLSRVLNVFTDVKEGNLASRDIIWKNGLTAFSTLHPIRQFFGIGYKGFPSFYEDYYGLDKNPHNTYVAVLIESGLLGSVFYLQTVFGHVGKFLSRKGGVLMIIIAPYILFSLTLGLESRRWLALTIFVTSYIFQNGGFNRELR